MPKKQKLTGHPYDPTEYYDPKDVHTPVKNADGSFTYTFSKKEKELLFECLSQFINRLDAEDTDMLKVQRKIRALRESF